MIKKNNARVSNNMEKFNEYFEGMRGDDFLVITHTDMDGIIAGSLVADYFKTKNVIMANYGKGGELGFDYKTVGLEGKDVIFTDYSFSTIDNLMAILSKKPNSLTIFDHHKTTLDLFKNKRFFDVVEFKAAKDGINLFYDIDINRCGAKITFDALNGLSLTSYNNAVKRLVDLVDGYDRWKFAPDNLNPVYINDYLYGSTQAYIMSPVVTEMLHNKSEAKLNEWIQIGKKFEDVKLKLNELTASTFAFEAEFHGYKVLAIEARGNSQLLGNAINEYPFIVIFHYDNRKKVFTYSLFKRANSDADILSIVREYGGGGHVCACGFVFEQRLVTPAR